MFSQDFCNWLNTQKWFVSKQCCQLKGPKQPNIMDYLFTRFTGTGETFRSYFKFNIGWVLFQIVCISVGVKNPMNSSSGHFHVQLVIGNSLLFEPVKYLQNQLDTLNRWYLNQDVLKTFSKKLMWKGFFQV